jgi:hypothetical protein
LAGTGDRHRPERPMRMAGIRILPRATGVAPVLTPLAAVGLGIIMVLAAIVHARRREARNVVVNVVILCLCLIVGWATY